jgi:hypothetical protein
MIKSFVVRFHRFRRHFRHSDSSKIPFRKSFPHLPQHTPASQNLPVLFAKKQPFSCPFRNRLFLLTFNFTLLTFSSPRPAHPPLRQETHHPQQDQPAAAHQQGRLPNLRTEKGVQPNQHEQPDNQDEHRPRRHRNTLQSVHSFVSSCLCAFVLRFSVFLCAFASSRLREASSKEDCVESVGLTSETPRTSARLRSPNPGCSSWTTLPSAPSAYRVGRSARRPTAAPSRNTGRFLPQTCNAP